jgi:hypothetical protein
MVDTARGAGVNTPTDFRMCLGNAETGKVRTSRSGGTDATTEPLLSAPFR